MGSGQEDLQSLIEAKKLEMLDYAQLLKEADEELSDAQITYNSLEPKYNELVNWAEEFMTMDIDEKRVIANQLIGRVTIMSGYRVEIELNMDYQQFCESWDIDDLRDA